MEGIAIDPSGNLYVADGNYNLTNNRVEKFSADGTPITQWGSYGNSLGQFNSPLATTVDSSGRIYVADYGNARIEEFNPNGLFRTQFGHDVLKTPIGIAIDSSNCVYVTDNSYNRVQKFDSNGNSVAQWGSLGNKNGFFDTPLGIAVDSYNRVYVVDVFNYRFQVFDSNGKYLFQVSSAPGCGAGQFNSSTWGIAVDALGFIYVVDGCNGGRVQKFAP